MTTEYSTMIRELSQQYYQGRISRQDYRAQRKSIIDRMDREHNGADGAAELYEMDNHPQGNGDA